VSHAFARFCRENDLIEMVCARCRYGIFCPIADEDSKEPLERTWQCARCGYVGRAVEAQS